MNEPSQDGTGEDGVLAALVRDSVAEVSLPAAFATRLASAVTAAKRRRRRRAVALGVAALVLGFAACAGLSAGRGGVRGEASPGVARALPGGAAAPLVAAPLAEAREGARRRRRRFFFFRRESSGRNPD